MPVIPIESIDDPRVLPYRDLPRSCLPRKAGLFIVEGKLLVERLLASQYEVDSVLVDTRHQPWIEPQVPAEVPIYVAPKALVEDVIGYNFHRGALACGRRRPATGLLEAIPTDATNLTIVVCVEIQDPENLGGIIRNCAAFGVDLVLLSQRCADPLSRRVLRVSMGTILRLPLVESQDVVADLRWLREQMKVELMATVLDQPAEPLVSATRPNRLALLLGNEGHGLGQQTLEMCQRRVTIPMRPGVDSLNVAVASGVFLYHFSSPATIQSKRVP